MTYEEAYDLLSEETLPKRISSTIVDVAVDISEESESVENHENRYTWARRALYNPEGEVDAVLFAVLVKNLAVSVEDVVAAPDSAHKGAVEEIVDVLAGV